MKPQNQPQIITKTIHFGYLFALLISFTIVPAFFFVWAAGEQKEAFMDQVQLYRQVQNKQAMLKAQIDSLFIQLSYVNTDKVTDHLPLEAGISKNRLGLLGIIGKDSSGSFRTYAAILKNLNGQLYLKDSIVKTVGQENMLKTDLISCMSKTKGINRSIFSQTQLSIK